MAHIHYEKGQIIDSYDNMDAFQNHFTKWKKT